MGHRCIQHSKSCETTLGQGSIPVQRPRDMSNLRSQRLWRSFYIWIVTPNSRPYTAISILFSCVLCMYVQYVVNQAGSPLQSSAVVFYVHSASRTTWLTYLYVAYQSYLQTAQISMPAKLSSIWTYRNSNAGPDRRISLSNAPAE